MAPTTDTDQAIVHSHANRYNGWTNYETWCVSLWLDNDEGTYNLVREWARDSEGVSAPASTLRDFTEEANPLNDVDASVHYRPRLRSRPRQSDVAPPSSGDLGEQGDGQQLQPARVRSALDFVPGARGVRVECWHHGSGQDQRCKANNNDDGVRRADDNHDDACGGGLPVHRAAGAIGCCRRHRRGVSDQVSRHSGRCSGADCDHNNHHDNPALYPTAATNCRTSAELSEWWVHELVGQLRVQPVYATWWWRTLWRYREVQRRDLLVLAAPLGHMFRAWWRGSVALGRA